MKRILAAGMLLVATLAAYGRESGKDARTEISPVTEGWVDNDTFRIVAAGTPGKGLTEKTHRMISARDAAVQMAQYLIIQKFIGARIEGASGMSDGATTGIAMSKEFGAMAKDGYIVKETYNDKDECEIIYEIKAPGLKNKVLGVTE